MDHRWGREVAPLGGEGGIVGGIGPMLEHVPKQVPAHMSATLAHCSPWAHCRQLPGSSQKPEAQRSPVNLPEQGVTGESGDRRRSTGTATAPLAAATGDALGLTRRARVGAHHARAVAPGPAGGSFVK